ncbi:hypothetical protein ACTOB_003686 [Actinoplanes oblitus]|uniref:Uncharacterized protein n=1 Tax=Actinoplanes oblitus TaxID=3040509 RepID=A0ABY8WT15_9ACTN|nr:hypothetical protein [Actinoplanes oblitus]WIN00011.1 hypothetical protein ACTOB_003686 [Actinoplanes oblitus]
MSAWIVNRDHIDLLLTAAVQWKLITAEQADSTGRMLWKENLTSVAHRYPNDHDGDRPGPCDFRDNDVDTYQYRPYPGRIDPEVVTMAAASLTYQSREHPGWAASAACEWVTRLRAQAADQTPAYLATYGPVDLGRQQRGDHGWSERIDADGTRSTHCSDGWSVPDRGVLNRAAALRTGAKP